MARPQSAGGALVVTGASQQAGNIDGTGDLVIEAGADLTANHVNQHALVIGGNASAAAVLTIAESGSGVSGITLDGSFASSRPFAAGIDNPANSLNAIDSLDFVSSGSSPELPIGEVSADGSAAVPEPSSLLLAMMGAAVAAICARRRMI